MITITEDYVSFETAKLLKEKGFNERLLTFYITDEAKKEGCFQLMAFTDDKIDNNHSDHCFLAPTLQMACKWLREVHNLYINIFVTWKDKIPHYQWSIDNLITQDTIYDAPCLEKYEEAVEAALKYTLENLI